jgi:hypothetical protein
MRAVTINKQDSASKVPPSPQTQLAGAQLRLGVLALCEQSNAISASKIGQTVQHAFSSALAASWVAAASCCCNCATFTTLRQTASFTVGECIPGSPIAFGCAQNGPVVHAQSELPMNHAQSMRTLCAGRKRGTFSSALVARKVAAKTSCSSSWICKMHLVMNVLRTSHGTLCARQTH